MLRVDERRGARPILWMCVIVGLVVLGAGCQTALPNAYVVEATTDPMFLVLTDEPGAIFVPPADAFDPEVPDSGGSAYNPGYGSTEGLTRALARLQGAPVPDPIAFMGTASEDRWLDLDAPVTGTVYISNSNSGSSPVALEAGVFRVQLVVDGQAAGGMDFALAPGAAASKSTWVPIHFTFRAEVAHIPAGAPVGLEVTMKSGLSDLRIGVGGDQQSFARIQTYPFDPLGGATYLEKHALVIQTPDDNLTVAQWLDEVERASAAGAFAQLPAGLYTLRVEQGEDIDERTVAIGGGLALAPLAFMVSKEAKRRGNRALLATVLLVAIALAGCSNAPESTDEEVDDGPISPVVEEKQEDLAEVDPESLVGEIKGQVRDWRNLSLPGAHVSIAGTSFFTETDENGRFHFRNVTAGVYGIRIDATDMRSLEKSIEVTAGKRTVLNIKMAPLDPSAPDRIAHTHNEWGGQDTVLVDELSFTPEHHGFYASGTLAPSGGQPKCVPWSNNGVHGRSQYVVCKYPVPFDVSGKVPPGAGQIEVTVTWTGDAAEVGLLAANGNLGRAEIDTQYMPRAQGEPFMVTFFPNEADPGHQQFTNWEYTLFVPSSDPTTFGQRPAVDVGKISVTIKAHKAVVPFEPGHPDMWVGADRIKLLDEDTVTFSTLNAGLPRSGTRWTMDEGIFVPDDTGHITGEFEVETGSAGETGLLINYGLAIKPSNVPNAQWEDGLIQVDLVGSFPKWEFTIEMQPGWGDQPYQTSSNFMFYPTSDSDQAYRGGTTFTLSATAHKGS